jgi:hypothetical protein
MPVTLSHFGEDIVHAMACKMGKGFLALCPGFTEEKVAQAVAIKEAPLESYADIPFDGASRVDMVLLLEGNRGVPFEIKLGSTRLSRTRISDEWLCGCKQSGHRPSRWTGNMMSILDRRFPPGTPEGPLRANYAKGTENQTVELTKEWFVLACEEKTETLRRNPPDFRASLISFESIVRAYEGSGIQGQAFNALVRDLLDIDFYQTWIIGRAE